jgi:hypothetical protein
VGKLGMLGSGCLAGLGALITFCFACTATLDVAGVLPTLSPTAVIAQAVSSNTPQATYTLTSTVTPRPTDTLAPTNTPTTTNTLIPSDTPIPPTDTPLPTDTPIPPTDTPLPTDTPIPPTDTPSSTNTPQLLSFEQIVATYEAMTDRQRQDYRVSLRGQRVHWKGTVTEVDSNGNVDLEMNPSHWGYSVHILELPADLAGKLQRNQIFEFDGVIDSAVDVLGLDIYLSYLSPSEAAALPQVITQMVTPVMSPTSIPSSTASPLPAFTNQTQRIGPIIDNARSSSYSLEITMTDVQWSTGGDTLFPPKPGNIFLIAHLRIRNVGPGNVYSLSSGYFQVRDANGALRDSTYVSDASDCELDTFDLVPGGTIEGCVGFEVPTTGRLEVIFAPFQYDSLKPGRYLAFLVRQ